MAAAIPDRLLDALRVREPRLAPLEGAWPSTELTRVSADGADWVVKRWIGPARESRGRAEALALDAFARRGFRSVPRPVRIDGGLWLRAGHPDALWTVQEFVSSGTRTRAAGAVTVELGARFGRVLAEFHLAGGGPARGERAPSRLSGVAARAAREAEAGVAGLRDAVRGELDVLLEQPVCRIHGDARFDNAVEGPRGLVLIDLEYTGFDLRLLDLASLLGGMRAADGTLGLTPPDVFAAAIDAYRARVEGTGLALAAAELALLPVAAAGFYLMVLDDVLDAGAHDPGLVTGLLGRLVGR